MRPTLLAALAFALAAGAAAAAPAADVPADGFDHIAHQGDVEAHAIKAPACDHCHAVDRAGHLTRAPGHAACFGAACHGKAPVRPFKGDDRSRRVCVACHRPALIDRLARGGGGAVPSSFPPYGPDGEFAISMSHAAHASVSGGCRACHGVPSEPEQPARRPAPGHSRCAACHARGAHGVIPRDPVSRSGGDRSGGAPGGVAMSACARCHTPAIGPVRKPHREAAAFPVRARFSHRKHMARGAACATCHAGAAAATGDVVPSPGKRQCAGCHDGKKAFGMVAAECRRCHAAPDREEQAPERKERARFSHASHQQSDCKLCHQLDARGMPGPIGRGHRPCGDASCHASDFAERSPVTCIVCHARAEPWRELHMDPQPTDSVEFAVDFPHARHGGAPCARCHSVRPSGRFGATRGHDTCAGAGCHAKSGGVRPGFDECASCHQRGAGDTRSRRQRRWSVRDQFTHKKHLAEPSDPKRAVACIECHTTVATATGLADLRPPGKATCARCHDGDTAFKLTGHSCNRCHLVR